MHRYIVVVNCHNQDVYRQPAGPQAALQGITIIESNPGFRYRVEKAYQPLPASYMIEYNQTGVSN